MRQLKFRIWDKQSKRFVRNDAGTHCISNWHIDAFTGEVVDFTASIGKFGFTKSRSPDYYISGTKVVKECPYVVQQFTGLLDKNGKKIYEGDIVRGLEYREGKTPNVMINEVKYDSWFGFDFKKYDANYGLEVVGHIFKKLKSKAV